jgi:Tn3 transposase DDE domain
VAIRRVIRTKTTKIEALSDLIDWVAFGGPAVKSGDPVEQEKQLKYANLVPNTTMLSNVADIIGVLASMVKDGHRVTSDLVACLSPYTREHIRRFGQYVLNWTTCPGSSSRSHCRSRRPCDHFLHVSSTYPYKRSIADLQVLANLIPARGYLHGLKPTSIDAGI